MIRYATYNTFDPLAYLKAYYSEIGTEADGLMKFLIDVFAEIKDGFTMLEFGGGPTIVGMIAPARYECEIHYCDYVAASRALVEKWLSGQDEDFDWMPFIRRTLQLEGMDSPTEDAVQTRSQQIRRRVTQILPCDLNQTPPVESECWYDVVTAHYCLDAVTSDSNEWLGHIETMKWMLKPGGTFVMSSLRHAKFSDFGGTRFSNVYLNEEDIFETLVKLGFRPSSINVVSAPADHSQREYSGVIFASARNV